MQYFFTGSSSQLVLTSAIPALRMILSLRKQCPPVTSCRFSHEYQSFSCGAYSLFTPFTGTQWPCHFFRFPSRKNHLFTSVLRLEVKPRFASRFTLHGQNQRTHLICTLVKLQGLEIREAPAIYDKTLWSYSFSLQGARLAQFSKAKHGPPVEPEGGIKNLLVNTSPNGLVIKISFLFFTKQLHDLHAALLA